jgi:hypothetical protein
MTVPIICLWHLVILWAIGLLWVTRAVRRNAITICWRRLRRFNLFYTRKSWQQLIKRMIAKALSTCLFVFKRGLLFIHCRRWSNGIAVVIRRVSGLLKKVK